MRRQSCRLPLRILYLAKGKGSSVRREPFPFIEGVSMRSVEARHSELARGVSWLIPGDSMTDTPLMNWQRQTGNFELLVHAGDLAPQGTGAGVHLAG